MRTYYAVFPENYLFTSSAVNKAIQSLLPSWTIATSPDDATLQFSDYDLINFESNVTKLFSSYPIRKSLIRKHFLAFTLEYYLKKTLDSFLRQPGVIGGIPKTFVLELSFADELDEAWQEELFDLGVALDAKEEKDGEGWWILKPSMTERGDGIVLFNSRAMLREILEDMENQGGDVDEETDGEGTGLSLSQLRHFVIQEYLPPLLISPGSKDTSQIPHLHKFHLRVYVLAVGALKVYYHSPSILSLFSSLPYSPPSMSALRQQDTITQTDLRSHLTNTCLQRLASDDPKEMDKFVFTLDELVGTKFNFQGQERKLTTSDINTIKDKIQKILGETFTASLSQPVHFQTRPDCFELFGVDFLLSPSTLDPLVPYLLEINACPDFGQTGSRLSNLIDEVMSDTIKTVVIPFFEDENTEENIGKETGWKQCLEKNVSKGW